MLRQSFNRLCKSGRSRLLTLEMQSGVQDSDFNRSGFHGTGATVAQEWRKSGASLARWSRCSGTKAQQFASCFIGMYRN
eukprot:12201927-Heterocapsa_arctica.AAC.1